MSNKICLKSCFRLFKMLLVAIFVLIFAAVSFMIALSMYLMFKIEKNKLKLIVAIFRSIQRDAEISDHASA